MYEKELLEELKKNIIGLEMSMADAPYFGVNNENIKGVRFAINKILEGTGLTVESLHDEMDQKGWFRVN